MSAGRKEPHSSGVRFLVLCAQTASASGCGRVGQTRTVRSAPPETSLSPSAVKATAQTQPVWPVSRIGLCSGLLASQRRTLPSTLEDASRAPSAAKLIEVTAEV